MKGRLAIISGKIRKIRARLGIIPKIVITLINFLSYIANLNNDSSIRNATVHSEASSRKMNVKVEGNLKTFASVNACTSKNPLSFSHPHFLRWTPNCRNRRATKTKTEYQCTFRTIQITWKIYFPTSCTRNAKIFSCFRIAQESQTQPSRETIYIYT